MANFNLNKVIIGGRLCADVEIKTTGNGTSVTSFTVAVNRPKRGKVGEQIADFISCTAWRNTAEFISKYFKKGSSICLCGVLQTRTWTDGDGKKHYATEVVAEEAYFVDSKGENGAEHNSAGYIPDAYNPPESAPHFEVITDDEELPF